MANRLSVAVITLNEASNLRRCLDSVADVADEIVVIDSGSTDATAAIAAEHGARFEHNDWPGHVAQKNVALSRCSEEWVLSLDADEALDEELANDIRALMAQGPAADGYMVNRMTWYLGDWVRHAWYPEWRLRLVRREKGEWAGQDPHDYLQVSGSTKKLAGHLLHYSYRDLSHHLSQTVSYARISSQQVVAKNKRVSAARVIFSPLGRLLRMLLLKQAWRDGWRGLLIAGTSAMSGFLKYAFALERQRATPISSERKH